MAQRGFEIASFADTASGWGAAPWVYPPAFDSLYTALADSLLEPPVDRDVVRAVAWQESKFDPGARSRSDALGLYQLKLSTASDVAKWRREPAPTESTLRDPAVNLRYGVEYLRWLLRQFDGRLVVALAAYNSGPNAVPPRWREWIGRGGEALFCEMIPQAETREYVRRILSTLAAYREIRPRAAER